MIAAVIDFCTRLKYLVLAASALVLVVAVSVIPESSVTALPEFTPTFVEVQTEALGLSAHEVEQMVTVPLEADLLNGVQDVETIRSQSLTSLSRIVMIFKSGVSEFAARARVQEKLTQSAALPQVSKPPTMMPPLSTENRLLMFTMEPDARSAIETSVLARWTVRPKLMSLPGVANVAIWGSRDRQLQVQVNPERLKASGVELGAVVDAVGNAQIVSPLTFLEASTPGTGGFIETPQQRLQVRHVFDKFASVEQMGQISVLRPDDSSVSVKDLATVVEDHQPLIGDAIGGKEGMLLLVVEKFPGANAVAVTDAVDGALNELQRGLDGIKIGRDYFRAVDYTSLSISNLAVALLVGAALLLIGLGVWFRDWRTPVVVGLAMVIGTAVSTLVVHGFGQGLNAVSLAGISAGVLILAVDAIIAMQASHQRGTIASLTASRGALGFATVMGLLTIVPLFVIQGRPGALLASLPFAYGVSTLSAWLVGMAVVPATVALIGRPRPALGSSRTSTAWSKRVGTSGAVTGLVALSVLAPVALVMAPKALTPEFNERDMVITLSSAPGTSLPAMTAEVKGAVAAVRGIAGVQSAVAHVGRAITADQIVDVNSAQMWVRLQQGVDRATAFSAVSASVSSRPGLQVSVDTFRGSRLAAVGGLTGGLSGSARQSLDVVTGNATPLVVRVYGEDPQVLLSKAKEIQKGLAAARGVVDPRVVAPTTQQAIEITVDLDKAKASAIKPGDVRRAEAILVQGIQVGSVFQGQKVFDVLVVGDDSARASVDAVKALWIDAPSGGHVRLSDVADVRTADVPVVIERDSVARFVDVLAGVDGDFGAAAASAQAVVDQISFPLEHHAKVRAHSTAQEMNLGYVVAIALVALASFLVVMQAAAASWSGGALGLAATLAAASGGAVVVAMVGLTIGSLLGLIVLIGVGARYALWSVHRSGGEFGADPSDAPTARVVLGTSAAAFLLVLPGAFMAGRPGLEAVGEFAWTIMAGLVTATVVGLFMGERMAVSARAAAPVPPTSRSLEPAEAMR